MILSPKTMEKLGLIITGDVDQTNYRSGPQLVQFFNQLGFHDSYSHGFPSRNSYALEKIKAINGNPEIDKCLKMAFNPIDYADKPDKLVERLDFFNKFLVFDNWKVVCENRQIKLVSVKQSENMDPNIQSSSSLTLEKFLQSNFNVDLSSLTIEPALTDILENRLSEIQNCISAGANLSAVIMIGSVLEGLLLAVAEKHPRNFNQVHSAPYNGKTNKVKPFHEWTLSNLIDCACDVGVLEDDVKKFSQVTREYRNYIHPYEQRRSSFNPSKETAEICLQVLKAAISQVNNYEHRLDK
ncbi:hypothetical protein IM774_12550 [Erysipelotrichaceae bacterium RD49]|nr:hypothetical protein [Erysipelotrichaceae bacterium RD49]